MRYSQFCSAISDILRKNSDPGTQFIQKALCKNNGVCPDVLFALPADSALGPVVYLEPLYDQYQKGIPMETICASVLSFLERRPPFPSSICQEILDPEFAKTRIAFRLVSQERNEELLKHIPWFPFHDLAMVFFICLDLDSADLVSALVPLAAPFRLGHGCRYPALPGRGKYPHSLSPCPNASDGAPSAVRLRRYPVPGPDGDGKGSGNDRIRGCSGNPKRH